MRRAVPFLLIALAATLAIGLAAGRPGFDGAPPGTSVTPGRQLLVFGGRGFGHGVGLQQWGARGAALAGLDAPRILSHYYPGTRVGTAPAREVRVLLSPGASPVRVAGAAGAARIVDGTSGRRLTVVPAGRTVGLVRAGDAITLVDSSGATLASLPGFVSVEPAAARGMVALDGAPYRGRLRVVAGAGGLQVVNIVSLEDYLLGVVPREMPASWGDDAPAALRAQAVAARSYALAGLRPGGGFDLYADQRSQVYGGAGAEDPRTTAAVRDTAGQVVTYEGKVITAFFSASSGGHTEDVQNAFAGARPEPYLTGVADPYDNSSPYHRWADPVVVDATRLAALLGLPGSVQQVDVVRRGVSPRVLRARVTTAFPYYRRVVVSGTDLRARLGLPDTWFTAVPRAEDAAGGALPAGAADRPDVWLAVLNGAGTPGLANRTADRAERRGYVGVATGDAPPRPEPSVAYWRPGSEAAARRAAADLGLPEAAPLPPGYDPGGAVPAGAQVIVVLGSG